MNTHRCPRCNTPVIIPEGRPGGVCKKCRRAVLLADLEQKPETGFLYLRLFLIFTVLASCGLLSFYIYQQTDGFTQTGDSGLGEIVAYIDETTTNVSEDLFPEPGGDIKGEPRIRNVAPRRFSLWQLHSSDAVRVVDIVTDPGKIGERVWAAGPSLRPEDNILSEQIIGGDLVERTIYKDYYEGTTYFVPNFLIRSSFDNVGYDMWVKTPPHLHINGDTRLISIGVDPKNYQQEIFAVAIPIDSRIISIYDYEPYRHITIGNWDIFYYDVSDIRWHVSIHIAYRPGGKAGALDWPTVELRR